MSLPPFDKAAAQRILEFMDWRDVIVIAIRQGVDGKGAPAPIDATVIGLGTLQGKHRSICQTLTFDKDLDWYALELSDRSARLWNKNGFQEVKTWATW